jgi:glutathione reductase (NADPH)
MWHAADIAEKIRHAKNYQFVGEGVGSPKFDWHSFKPLRDQYIRKLNGIYDSNLQKDGVEQHHGYARIASPNSVEVTKEDGSKYTLTGDQICIAVGGTPTYPDLPGAELGIDSDGFFDLPEQPRRVAVVGAGYIAVELAGVLHTLGSETHLLIRQEKVLRTFDPTLQDVLTNWMEKTGVNIHKKTNVTKVEGTKGGPLTVYTDSGEPFEVDTLIWAIGRHSKTSDLGLEKVGIQVDSKGNIPVDEYQQTSVPSITAIGDVAGEALLTPVAIAAGRRLSNRLFGPPKFKNDKLSYENIPTVVFSLVF